jgi:hypothetical protein
MSESREVPLAVRLAAMSDWRERIEEGMPDMDTEEALRFLSGVFTLVERGTLELVEENGRWTARSTCSPVPEEREERDWKELAGELQGLVDELLYREQRLLGLLSESTARVERLSRQLIELSNEISGGPSSDIA